MKTPRIEEMYPSKPIITTFEATLEVDAPLSQKQIEQITKALTQAHQAGIDEAVDIVKGLEKPLIKSIAYTKENERARNYNQALNDTIKALQDNK